MPNLMDVYYIRLLIWLVLRVPLKQNCTVWMATVNQDTTGRLRRLAEYMLQQHAGRNWVCTTILKGETENDE
jgi:hypothetical protein